MGGIALAAIGAAVGAGAAVLVAELLRSLTGALPLDPWKIAGVVLRNEGQNGRRSTRRELPGAADRELTGATMMGRKRPLRPITAHYRPGGRRVTWKAGTKWRSRKA